MAARIEAVRLIAAVLDSHTSLDEALLRDDPAITANLLDPRDRAFARLIAASVLRRKGSLQAVLSAFLSKPLPFKTGTLWPILLAAAAQLLLLDTPAHAAISLSVDQVRLDPKAARFDKLVNALLRKVATEGKAKLAALDTAPLDLPPWLFDRWTKTYGAAKARVIAEACLTEAPLDLSAKGDGAALARMFGKSHCSPTPGSPAHPEPLVTLLPTGTVRIASGGRIEALPGYDAGDWWVQDAGAALPALLVNARPGQSVADLCAAPGGKTAQLAAAGAAVTAVEASPKRLDRVAANLKRLGLEATLIAADVRKWRPATHFDAVLLDAPCSSSGTIRRHPDIPHLKRGADLMPLVALQAELLDAAAKLVRPGGRLVYCTCSLEPEEGEQQWDAFLVRHPEFARLPVTPSEVGGQSHWITPDGDLRTLPGFGPVDAAGAAIDGGVDGFFVGRGVRL